MSDFFVWLKGASEFYKALSFIAFATSIFMVAIIFETGKTHFYLWIDPVLIWIISPSSIVIYGYFKDRSR